MGIFSNRVEKTELEAGDHIYTWRTAFIYAHHGEGKVVHFTQDATKFQLGGIINIASCANSTTSNKTRASGCSTCEAMGLRKKTGGVVTTCLDCFLGSGSLYRFQYGVSKLAFVFKLRGGTCHMKNCDPPQTVLDRAMKLLEDGFGDYHVFANNCEDFAYYCKTGRKCGRNPSSCQVSSSIGGTAAALYYHHLHKTRAHHAD